MRAPRSEPLRSVRQRGARFRMERAGRVADLRTPQAPFPRTAYWSPVRSSSETIVIVRRLAMPPRDAGVDVPDNVRESRGDRGHGPPVQPWSCGADSVLNMAPACAWGLFSTGRSLSSRDDGWRVCRVRGIGPSVARPDPQSPTMTNSPSSPAPAEVFDRVQHCSLPVAKAAPTSLKSKPSSATPPWTPRQGASAPEPPKPPPSSSASSTADHQTGIGMLDAGMLMSVAVFRWPYPRRRREAADAVRLALPGGTPRRGELGGPWAGGSWYAPARAEG